MAPTSISPGGGFANPTRDASQAADLEPRVKAAMPVLAMGDLTIDFENRLINVETNIPCAPWSSPFSPPVTNVAEDDLGDSTHRWSFSAG